MQKLKRCFYLLHNIFIIFIITSCAQGGKDEIYFIKDQETKAGQWIQSNGFFVDTEEMDKRYYETMVCMGLSGIEPHINIILKEPYEAFPCGVLPNGCGGLFDFSTNNPTITISADLIRLKHEYVHFLLWKINNDPDPEHKSDWYDRCS